MKKLLVFVLVLGFASMSLAAQEISIIAKQFDFLPKQIKVERGVPVKLYLTSVDVDHGIRIKAFGIDKEIKKGEIVEIEFTPDKAGEFEIGCSVFCGLGHGGMKGKLFVEGYKDISAEELKAMMKNRDFFLVDVHIPEQQHIKGTDAFIPFNEIERNLDKLPKDRNTKIVIYCRTGPMSETASKTLQRLGYKNIYDLKGGIRAWKKVAGK